MSKVKVCAFTVSIDGFGAGPDQSLEQPMGVGGEGLHPWMFHTRTFQQVLGRKTFALGAASRPCGSI